MAFGDVPEVPVATLFNNRRALYDAGIHRIAGAGRGVDDRA